MKQKLILLTVLLNALSAFSTEYFVDASRPDDSGTATNWVTAKKTIQAAVDLTVGSDTVWVTNGTYVLSSEISVTNAITIRSVNGSDVTVVDGCGSNRCFNLYNSACLISGFTVTRGTAYDTAGGGIYCDDTTPVVSNCLIVSNETTPISFSLGFSGGGMRNGTAINCVFVSNGAYDGGGMSGGHAYRCVFTKNYGKNGQWGESFGAGMSHGEAYDCLFVENTGSSAGCGAGMYEGTAYNCTFISNWTRIGGGALGYSTAYNCIFKGNEDSDGSELYCSSVYNSCSVGLTNGVDGNITNAPLFVDEANGDFRLHAGSPCIDAGNNSYVSTTSDLDGNPRIAGGVVDMGAYEAPEYHTLTVTNGIGSGSYTNQQRVAISADAPASGKAFDQWTGDTQYVARVTSLNTLVTMPSQAIALTATYKDITYTLTVTSGTGGGAYTNETQVLITASNAPTGQAFDRWIGDTQYVDSVTASTATVTMPTNAVSLTATYTNLLGWYTLTVTNGTGGGAYTNGTQVLIAANAPTGQAFDRWVGATQFVDSVTSTNATVTMPAQDVSLNATYTNLPGWYTLTVNSGTGGGTYTNGTRITIAPDAPPTGKAFSRWIDDEGSWSDIANETGIMPARDYSVTAIYTNLPGWYTLAVTNGTGGGAYTNETQVLITASNAPTGQAFDRWIGDTQYVDSVASTNATVTMPTNAVSLIATYTNLPGWYTLTVNNGTGGSGPYTNGTQVFITASNAPRGQAFARWAGATQYVAGVTSTNATVTMPAQDISLTATYTNLSGWYTLTVNNGAGDGPYTNGARIVIAANAPVDGKTFNRWTGDTQVVANVTSPNTIVTMPTKNISVTATYGYYLMVHRAAGSGFYTNGQKVAITFWPFGVILPSGWVFDRWIGDTQVVANVTSTTTIVTMPATSVVCVADFRDVQKPMLTVNSPTNGEHVGSALIKVAGKVTDNDGATDIFIRLNGGGWMTNSVLRNTNGAFATSWTNKQLTTGWTTNNGFSGTTSWATNDALNYNYAAINIIGPTTNNGRFGTTSWTNSLTLKLGPNVFQIYARDETGNISTTNTLNFVYVIAGDLTLQTNGPGTVIRAPTGVPEVGRTYTLTAVPKIGTVFTGWSGDSTSTNRVLSFTMTNSLAFTANFTDIQKPTVAIVYPAAKKPQRVVTTGTVVLRGTAADNDRLAEVKYQLYTGEWTNAVTTNGWKNWTADFYPVPGLNTARVYSVDLQGNVSVTSKAVFTYALGAVMQVRTNGQGSITPAYNGQMLEIGKSYTMTAKPKSGYVFTAWADGTGTVTNKPAITFVMRTNLVLTANFRSLSARAAMADAVVDMSATPQAAIVVDGAAKDWANVPKYSFSYASVTQEVAVALDGNNIALLLKGCPFETSDNILVYFKLRLSYGAGDNRHSVDLWTSGSVLYGMVDGKVIAGLEAVLLNGVLEIKLPVEQVPSQVTIEELGCGMDLGGGTLTELFKLTPPPILSQ